MLRGLAGYEGLLIYGLTRVTRGPVAGIYTELAQAATRFPKVISRQTIPRLAHTSTDTVPASNIHLGARSRINCTPQRIYGDAGILYCRNTFWFRSKEAAWARDSELELGKGRESLAAAWCLAEPQVLVGKCQGEMSSLFPPA